MRKCDGENVEVWETSGETLGAALLEAATAVTVLERDASYIHVSHSMLDGEHYVTIYVH